MVVLAGVLLVAGVSSAAIYSPSLCLAATVVPSGLRATSMAYDDLLVAACTALDVPAPPRDGHALLDPIDRLTLEAELARAGLSW